MVYTVSVQRRCKECNRIFWWSVAEQRECESQGLPPPSICQLCEKYSYSTALVPSGSNGLTVPPALEVMSPEFAREIEALLLAAQAPVEDRMRTFSEWWNDTDIRSRQLQQKALAGETANTLIRQRVELLGMMRDAKRAELEDRVFVLQTKLAEMKLEAQIAECEATRVFEVQSSRVIAEQRYQRLLEPPPSPPEPALEISRSERLVQEHLENATAKSRARRSVIQQCRAEVREIFASDQPDDEAAYEIRAVLDAYGLPETALQKRVQKFLAEFEGD